MHVDDRQTLRCLQPGRTTNVAFLDQGSIHGWERVGACAGGQIIRKIGGCLQCPARNLPPEARPQGARVTKTHVDVDLACAEGTGLAAAYHALRVTRQAPTLLSKRRSRPAMRAIDLGSLTTRQQEALQAAHRLGYFRPGSQVGAQRLAAAMDCSKSTAHEHLQRALERLLAATFPGPVRASGDVQEA